MNKRSIDDAVQRMKKGIAECNERIYEKALADFQKETKAANYYDPKGANKSFCEAALALAESQEKVERRHLGSDASEQR